MKESVMSIIEGTGIFIYPLGVCSVLAVFMIVERLIALQTRRVIPESVNRGLVMGEFPTIGDGDRSVAGRIVRFSQKKNPEAEELKAYAKLEAGRMERGLFILDIVVGAAPLLGLLGTVMGLIQVFSYISPETGMPEPSAFVQGIALALTTTMLGLVIAIPALVGNSYLGRRVEVLSTKLDVVLERLLEVSKVS